MTDAADSPREYKLDDFTKRDGNFYQRELILDGPEDEFSGTWFSFNGAGVLNRHSVQLTTEKRIELVTAHPEAEAQLIFLTQEYWRQLARNATHSDGSSSHREETAMSDFDPTAPETETVSGFDTKYPPVGDNRLLRKVPVDRPDAVFSDITYNAYSNTVFHNGTLFTAAEWLEFARDHKDVPPRLKEIRTVLVGPTESTDAARVTSTPPPSESARPRATRTTAIPVGTTGEERVASKFFDSIVLIGCLVLAIIGGLIVGFVTSNLVLGIVAFVLIELLASLAASWVMGLSGMRRSN